MHHRVDFLGNSTTHDGYVSKAVAPVIGADADELHAKEPEGIPLPDVPEFAPLYDISDAYSITVDSPCGDGVGYGVFSKSRGDLR